MRKTFKKILCSLLVVVMCLASAPLQGFVGMEWPSLPEINFGEFKLPDIDFSKWFASEAKAVDDTLAATGKCGDNVYWDYNSTTGELLINGTGNMWNYSSFETPFYYSSIKRVVIESGVTSIGSWIFSVCTSLSSITIPNTVTNIAEGAFFFCTNLTSITIPYSVKTIGLGAFLNCESLEFITVDANNAYYSSDNYGVLFDKEKTCLIQYPIGKTSVSYIVPNGITTINYYAFQYCTNLERVIISDGVTIIDGYTFYGCTNLKSVTIPNSVTVIQDCAFRDCSSLKSITIPSSVEYIGRSILLGCKSLESIMVDAENMFYSSDKDGVLYDKDKTCLIQYPVGNTKTSYIVPSGTTSIGSGAFSQCTAIKELIISEGVEIIGDLSFEFCTSLTNITIPKSVTSIGSHAFHYCINLKNATIPSGIKSINDWAFAKCESLTNIIIPNGVTSIGERAFDSCRSFTNIVIPNSVKTIGEGAFYGCTNLISVTIPNSVTAIDDFAFYWCLELSEVNYTGNETQWNKISFGNNVGLENIIIHFLNISISHVPGDWEVILEATYAAEGKKVVRCITCGEILEEESIPKLVGKELVDTDTGVIIDLGTGLYNGKVDIIVNKSADENAFNLVHTATGAVKSDIYDINLTIDGVISQPKGYVTVKIPVPNGYNPNRCFIYYINTKNGSAEKIPTRYEDGYLVFETNHFSYYAVVEIDNTDNVDCSCNCHKGGIKGFFFKLILFFQKIFKSNKECKCGINHY